MMPATAVRPKMSQSVRGTLQKSLSANRPILRSFTLSIPLAVSCKVEIFLLVQPILCSKRDRAKFVFPA